MDRVQAAPRAAAGAQGSAETGDSLPQGNQPQERLAPFPVPVHFMFRGRKPAWLDLFDGATPPPDPDAIPHRIIEVEECWIVQTYLRLWHAGLKVTLSDRFKPDAINVVSYHDLAIKDRPIPFYIVATQHDAARPEICDRRVVQNELNVLTARDHFIPHWPQPGLIPRDAARGQRIETLCFKGSECNLYGAFRSPEFIADLQRLGVRLQYDVKEGSEKSAPSWNDYRECDLVLAVRDATEEDLKIKPASKLVNAWLAGTPALLGPEPAFAAMRRGPLDYFEVSKPADVLEAVRRLREDATLYSAMAQNGLQRGMEYTHQRITEKWHALLAGPAAEDFARKRSRPALLRMADPLRFIFRALRHKRNLRVYRRKRDHGYRPISNRYT